jgi:hypothetical protein
MTSLRKELLAHASLVFLSTLILGLVGLTG